VKPHTVLSVKLRQSLTTRQGRKVPRMLYQQLGPEPADDDPVIGLVDTPELAALIVAAVNARHHGGMMKPHPYQPPRMGFHCRRCGSLRTHRCHQPLWWRVLHPGATWR